MTSILEHEYDEPILNLKGRKVKRLSIPNEMPHVKSLILQDNPIQSLTCLKLFPQVERLFLDQTSHKTNIIGDICHCQKLRVLTLRDVHGSFEQIEIPEHPSLQTLDLSANFIEQDYFRGLQLRSLKQLYFSNCKLPLNTFTIFADVFMKGPCEFAEQGYVMYENLILQIFNDQELGCLKFKVKKMKQKQQVPNFDMKITFYSLLDGCEVQKLKLMNTSLSEFLVYQMTESDFKSVEYGYHEAPLEQIDEMVEDSRKIQSINGGQYYIVVVKINQTNLVFCLSESLKSVNFQDLEVERQEKIDNMMTKVTQLSIVKQEANDDSEVNNISEASEDAVDFVKQRKLHQKQRYDEKNGKSPVKTQLPQKIDILNQFHFINSNYKMGEIITLTGVDDSKVDFFVTQMNTGELENSIQFIITQQKLDFQQYDIKQILFAAMVNFNRLPTPLIQNDEDSILQLNLKIGSTALPFIVHFDLLQENKDTFKLSKDQLNRYILARSSTFNKQMLQMLPNEISFSKDTYFMQVSLFNQDSTIAYSQLFESKRFIDLSDLSKIRIQLLNGGETINNMEQNFNEQSDHQQQMLFSQTLRQQQLEYDKKIGDLETKLEKQQRTILDLLAKYQDAQGKLIDSCLSEVQDNVNKKVQEKELAVKQKQKQLQESQKQIQELEKEEERIAGEKRTKLQSLIKMAEQQVELPPSPVQKKKQKQQTPEIAEELIPTIEINKHNVQDREPLPQKQEQVSIPIAEVKQQISETQEQDSKQLEKIDSVETKKSELTSALQNQLISEKVTPSEEPKKKFVMPKVIKASAMCKDRISIKIITRPDLVNEQTSVIIRPNFETDEEPYILIFTQSRSGVFTIVDVPVIITKQDNFQQEVKFKYRLADCGLLPFLYVQMGDDFRFVQIGDRPLKYASLETKNVFQYQVTSLVQNGMQVKSSLFEISETFKLKVNDKKQSVTASCKRQDFDVFLPSKYLLSPNINLEDCLNDFLFGVQMIQSSKITGLYDILSLENEEELLLTQVAADIIHKNAKDAMINWSNLLVIRINGYFILLFFKDQVDRDMCYVYSNIFKGHSFFDVNMEQAVGTQDESVSQRVNLLYQTQFLQDRTIERQTRIVISDIEKAEKVTQSVSTVFTPGSYGILQATQNDDIKYVLPISERLILPAYLANHEVEVLAIGDFKLESEFISESLEGQAVDAMIPAKGSELKVKCKLLTGEIEDCSILIDAKVVKIKGKSIGSIKTDTSKIRVYFTEQLVLLKFGQEGQFPIIQLPPKDVQQLAKWFAK